MVSEIRSVVSQKSGPNTKPDNETNKRKLNKKEKALLTQELTR